MDSEAIKNVVIGISAHGYWYMFILMLVEGPIVTIAGAFASALGFFNPFIVFLISIPGDLVADVVFYLAGYFLRDSVVDRFVKKFGFGTKQIKKLDLLVDKHAMATLIAIKLSPFLPPPGLMLIGNSKMSFRKYITICLYIIVPKSIILILLGYYTGVFGNVVGRYLDNYWLVLVFAVMATIIIYWGYKKISVRLSNKIEKELS